MRGRCHAETRPAWVVEPLQHSKGRSQLRPKSRWLLDLASPSSALSWVCFVSGSILRGLDPLTLVSCPTAVAFWYSAFPHDRRMFPSELTDSHGAYSSSPPAPPDGYGHQGGRG